MHVEPGWLDDFPDFVTINLSRNEGIELRKLLETAEHTAFRDKFYPILDEALFHSKHGKKN